MSMRTKLSDEALAAFISSQSGWSVSESRPPAIEKTFTFKDYPSGIAFVVRLAFAAEKREHHPDLEVHWGKVKVAWSTHDAGGITSVDAEMAEATDKLYASA